MTKIRFRDLTIKQLSLLHQYGVLNGCGGKGHWLDPPDFLFTASCDHHDFNYWLGGTEEDREKADTQFYEAMLKDAAAMPWWSRQWYKFVAWTYYKAVRKYAQDYFYYADAERTKEDLEQVIKEGEASC